MLRVKAYFSKVSRAILTIFFTSASRTDDKPPLKPFAEGGGISFFPLPVNKIRE